MAGEIKFKRRSGGTGAILLTTSLSVDGATPIPSDYRQEPDAVLTKYAVLVHYFTALDLGVPDIAREARRLVVARLDALKSALLWRGTPIVRQLGMGKAYMPNVYDNFGDLVAASTTGDSLLLDNCTLFDASIEDDQMMVEGIVLKLTFARVCDAMSI